jgi:hypothetical protein
MHVSSQIYEQIAKYLTTDNSVFQYSNANDMRVTQDLNSYAEIIAHAQCSVDEKKNIYTCIQCVPHKNNCKKKIGSHNMKQRFLNNHCQECVRAYLRIHDCLSFLHKVMCDLLIKSAFEWIFTVKLQLSENI